MESRMHRVIVLGAGKIGALISGFLGETGDYEVQLVDVDGEASRSVAAAHGFSTVEPFELDASDPESLRAHLKKHPADALVSSLPFYCNEKVAEVARELGLHYFDLTEDVKVTHAVRAHAEGATTAFVPQCGLAPGFISIVAHELMNHFDKAETVKLRVGALPQHPNNVLKYSLTWSTDGLINEYANPCQSIVNGEMADVLPLEGLEEIEIDGTLYEAFNTSGGLGSLGETHGAGVRTMNYKTIRYRGHCAHIRLLMNGLRLREDQATLKKILEKAIPRTLQDVIVIYVSVTGQQDGEFREENYVNKVYPQVIAGRLWSSIQVTTAAGLCAVLDLILSHPENYHGFVTQEDFSLKDVLNNRFGAYYAQGGTNEVSARLIATGEAGRQRTTEENA
jgi:saccharopine dehydrogenase-like NADP-dependent oxidoreductase